MYIPPGFAHGFCVVSETALFMYKCTAPYAPDAERGIVWNDPELNIPWPIDKPRFPTKTSGTRVFETPTQIICRSTSRPGEAEHPSAPAPRSVAVPGDPAGRARAPVGGAPTPPFHCQKRWPSAREFRRADERLPSVKQLSYRLGSNPAGNQVTLPNVLGLEHMQKPFAGSAAFLIGALAWTSAADAAIAVEVTSPLPGSDFADSLTINAAVMSPVYQVTLVSAIVDTLTQVMTCVGISPVTCQATLSTTSLSPGPKTLKVTAVNAFGETSDVAVPLTLYRPDPPPTVIALHPSSRWFNSRPDCVSWPIATTRIPRVVQI